MSLMSDLGALIKAKLNLKADKHNPTFTGLVTLPIDTHIGNINLDKIHFLDNVETDVQNQISEKQVNLVSGTNIRTINSIPILGSGNIVTTQTTITGNAGTATKLATPRLINAVPFDGSSNLTITALTPNSSLIKFDSGTTEGTDLFTFNGSTSKVIDIKAGSNIILTKTAGAITISSNSLITSSIAFKDVLNKPTTLAGYGITDSQSKLVSGTNIKTVNGVSILGTGDIAINVTSISGNAGTATKLKAPITINGVLFDGSSNINITDNTKAPLYSPGLSGIPTAPTAALGTSNTQIATTAFVFANSLHSAQLTASKAVIGYQKLPSGVIIQWGSLSVSDNATYNITLPIAFTTVNNPVASLRDLKNGGSNIATVCARPNGLAQITVETEFGYALNTSVFWIAIGY